MVVFDKVPPCYNSFEQGHTAFVQTIMRCIPTVERCIQDRFHVSHNMSKFFNNMCPTYNFLILVGWRHATVVRDAQDVEAVDQALMAGLIQKSRRCATITRGQKPASL